VPVENRPGEPVVTGLAATTGGAEAPNALARSETMAEAVSNR
jgi:hypothetical protein